MIWPQPQNMALCHYGSEWIRYGYLLKVQYKFSNLAKELNVLEYVIRNESRNKILFFFVLLSFFEICCSFFFFISFFPVFQSVAFVFFSCFVFIGWLVFNSSHNYIRLNKNKSCPLIKIKICWTMFWSNASMEDQKFPFPFGVYIPLKMS